MTQERSNEKKASLNGGQDDAGRTLQAPPFCPPACRRLGDRRGSQIIEYALVIAAISAAFTVMFIYGKRGLQAIIHNKVEREIGPQADGLAAVGFASDQWSQSQSSTVSEDHAHATLNPAGTAIEMDSSSGTAGNTTSVVTD